MLEGKREVVKSESTKNEDRHKMTEKGGREMYNGEEGKEVIQDKSPHGKRNIDTS